VVNCVWVTIDVVATSEVVVVVCSWVLVKVAVEYSVVVDVWSGGTEVDTR